DVIVAMRAGLCGVGSVSVEVSWEEFKEKREIDQVEAIEINLGQAAKARGGHVEGGKVTEESAQIRKVEPWVTINSPNRFRGISNGEELLAFVDQLRDVGGKPVGTKIVAGDEHQVEAYIQAMKETGIVPDFITVDGGN